MSDDELEKLAAEMQNIKPSETARTRGMDAAMAAFDMEFAANDVKEATPENISQENIKATQGLEAAPRPTGQSTGIKSVQALGSSMMTKFNKIFDFKPRTAMLAGSCMAALFASAIYVQTDRFERTPSSKQVITVAGNNSEVSEDTKTVETFIPSLTAETQVESAEAVANNETREDKMQALLKESSRVFTPPSTEKGVAPKGAQPGVTLAPQSNAGITSISDLLNKIHSDSAKASADNKAREAKFRVRRDHQAKLFKDATGKKMPADTDQALREYRAALQQKDNIQLFVAQQNILTQAEAAKAAAQGVQTAPAPVIAVPPMVSATPLASAPAPAPSVSNPRLAVRQTPAPATTLMTEAPAPMLNQKINGYTLEAAPPKFETVTETVVVQEAATELVSVPATYETYTDTVVVQEASTELVTIPAQYEWVDGDIDGSSIEYVVVPAEYETVSETVVVKPASTEYVSPPKAYETVTDTVVVQQQYLAVDGSVVPAVTQEVSRRVSRTPASTQERVIPAITKQVSRRVVKKPATTVERIVPYEKRDGKTRVVKTPAKTVERVIPNVAKQETRRRIKQPAATQERVVPAVTKEVQVRKLVAPQTFYLRDDDGNVVREFASLDEFEIYKSNLPTSVQEKPVSTFSVDVDTASYSFLRASINSGKLPPRSAIRVEELINYFPYDYEAPKSTDEPFKANVTVTPTPWNADTKLMHIGIKGYVPPADERPRSNIVFLIDTSGSMKAANKLPLLINSFKLLLGTLDADDTISIVTYAASVGTALEPTSARDKDKIYAALNRLQASGGTAGGAGLQLAYEKAQENFDEEGVNRIILATDGDFNIGFSSPDEMKTFIEQKRETGIFLSVLGFGMGNYKDDIMQSLAQNGNGVAAYIDNLAEANKVLANEAGSALITIAKDVKIQVEFNPATVSEYRLIGYETRALKRQDFNNDKVDAGEIGAGHTVTAIYEMTPVGSPAQTVDDLRYVKARVEPLATGSDEYAFVKIRHKLPNADTSTLQSFPVGPGSEREFRRASKDMRFATAVAAVGQKLRGDIPLEDFSYEDAIKLAKKAKGKDEHGYRAEFIQLVRLMESLEK